MRGKSGMILVSILALAVAGVWASASKSLRVTVEFDGGPVSAEHPIWIFVWDNADFNGTIPIAVRTLDGNGKTAAFEALPSPVYITVAYDEKGGYNPQFVGPPPSGTPVSAYLTDGATAPSPIELGGDGGTEISLRFDGSFRMP